MRPNDKCGFPLRVFCDGLVEPRGRRMGTLPVRMPLIGTALDPGSTSSPKVGIEGFHPANLVEPCVLGDAERFV